MKERLREAWESYRKKVVPAGAGEVQVRETQLAFFAGAQAIFSRLVNGLEPGSEPTEADLMMVSDLDQELRQFVEGIS